MDTFYKLLSLSWKGIFLFSATAIAFATACKFEEQRGEEKKKELQFAALTILWQESGHCAVSQKQDEGTAFFSCIPVPRTLCNLEKLFDPTGRFITTEETASRVFARAQLLAEDRESCNDLEASLFFQPWSIADSDLSAKQKRSTISTGSVSACDFSDPAILESPLGESDTRRLNSIDGRIAFSALSAGLEDCAAAIADESLLDIARSVISGQKSIGTLCTYGSDPAAGYRVCTDVERKTAEGL